MRDRVRERWNVLDRRVDRRGFLRAKRSSRTELFAKTSEALREASFEDSYTRVSRAA